MLDRLTVTFTDNAMLTVDVDQRKPYTVQDGLITFWRTVNGHRTVAYVAVLVNVKGFGK